MEADSPCDICSLSKGWTQENQIRTRSSPWHVLLITSSPRIDLPNEGEEDLSTQTPDPSSNMETLLENKKSHWGRPGLPHRGNSTPESAHLFLSSTQFPVMHLYHEIVICCLNMFKVNSGSKENFLILDSSMFVFKGPPDPSAWVSPTPPQLWQGGKITTR